MTLVQFLEGLAELEAITIAFQAALIACLIVCPETLASVRQRTGARLRALVGGRRGT